MSRSVSLRCHVLVATACCLALSGQPLLGAQEGAQNGEWRSFGGDVGSTKYSPLAQIDKDNVADLRIAWRWPSVDGQFDLDRLRQEYVNLRCPMT